MADDGKSPWITMDHQLAQWVSRCFQGARGLTIIKLKMVPMSCVMAITEHGGRRHPTVMPVLGVLTMRCIFTHLSYLYIYVHI